uniref:ATP synthase CF0 B subunit n=1 Tax=Gastroclonium compressum TaxID=1852973 RepID=A0A173G010_GASCM|nr:ATP synthase CF0 B subunit [Coeloseira compressa]ANH09610.1 ATP synthase CF0 B subunit [Coeloseira compressa]
MHSNAELFSIFSFYSHDGYISLNSNFLEANVINITLLLLGLIYVLKQFLGAILLDRQQKVLLTIQEAEERLQQANIRLSEAQKQLEQTQMIIQEIIDEAKSTAQKVRQSILDQGQLDVERLTIASKVSIKTAELQIRQQIQQKVIALAIKRVTILLQNQVTKSMQSQLIDNSIIQLGE